MNIAPVVIPGPPSQQMRPVRQGQMPRFCGKRSGTESEASANSTKTSFDKLFLKLWEKRPRLLRRVVHSASTAPVSTSQAPSSSFAAEVDFLASPAFSRVLESCADAEARQQALATAIYIYSTLGQPANPEPIADFLQAVEFKSCNFYPDDMCKLAIQFYEWLEKKDFNQPEDALEIALKLLRGSQTHWHGSNAYFLSEISRCGLNRVRPVDPQLKQLNDILLSKGLETHSILGSYQYCTDTIYTSGDPSSALDYSARSPEWFAHLSGGFRGKRTLEKAKRHAYLNLTDLDKFHFQLGQGQPLTDEEAAPFLQMLETLFPKLSSSPPVVLQLNEEPLSESAALYRLAFALLPERVISTANNEMELKQLLLGYIHPQIFKNQLIRLMERDHEVKVAHMDYAPEAITVFKLPPMHGPLGWDERYDD